MKTLRLGNICTKIGSGATPRGGSEVYLSRGVALIRSQNIYNDGFRADGLAFIGDEHACQLANVEVRAGDILLNITGDSVARACRAPHEVLPARVNQHVAIIRPNPDELDPRYLHYHLISPAKQAAMLSLAGGGATRNALTKGMIENFEVSAPPPEDQRAIAGVLGALDDKIEQNRRTARAAERLARAIFRAWFVDFEPVKAKAESASAFPGMPQSVFDTLPSRFVDSAIGRVPEGWEAGVVGDLATIAKTQVNPQGTPQEVFDHFSIPAFDSGMRPVAELGGAIRSNKFLVMTGCILLSKLNPRIARVWLPPMPDDKRQIASTEFLVIMPRHAADRHYLYCQFGQAAFHRDLAHRASGTSSSHQRVRPIDVLGHPVVITPASTRKSFDDIIDPLFSLIEANQIESVNLARMRDYLLPRLLSGEVRVRDAERMAATAT